MILFLDNDALGKFSSWDLLEHAVLACGSSPPEIRVLPSARFQLGIAGKQRRSKYSAEALSRIDSLLKKGQACAQLSSSVIDELSAIVGLDSGEALLYALAADIDESLVLTGDKVSMRAISGATGAAQDVAKKLSGRVLCLEQALLRIIQRIGFEGTRDRIVGSNALTLDTAVRAAFGSGAASTSENACGALGSYVESLRAETGSLLTP